MSRVEDYAEEAEFFEKLLTKDSSGSQPTLLELGSGGGNNAFYLKRRFCMTLVDRSAAMLEVSTRLNPECVHLQGDMRTLRLDREFDNVFIHDAIMYMTTRRGLYDAIECACLHCRPGGVVLIAPDCVRESFKPSTDHGGHDGDGRSLRYLEWTHDPDPSDDVYDVDFVFMLRDGEGLRVERDHHVHGLFARDVWIEALVDAGVMPRVVTDRFGRELFTGEKQRYR